MVASSNLRSRTLDLLTNIFLRLPLANNILLLTLPVKSLSQCNGLGSLPEELVINILLRLPVKSLLQCKSVCKEWHALISSPSFIKGHFSHEGNLTRLVYIAMEENIRDHSIALIHIFRMKPPSKGTRYQIIYCCGEELRFFVDPVMEYFASTLQRINLLFGTLQLES